jgi:hypothetical protein
MSIPNHLFHRIKIFIRLQTTANLARLKQRFYTDCMPLNPVYVYVSVSVTVCWSQVPVNWISLTRGMQQWEDAVSRISQWCLESICKKALFEEIRSLVMASVVPGSAILVTQMMKAILSSEKLALTRATRRHISEDCILHNHRHETSNLTYRQNSRTSSRGWTVPAGSGLLIHICTTSPDLSHCTQYTARNAK